MQHIDIIKDLEHAQESEFDTREKVRENEAMADVRGGQWEYNAWSNSADKPKYQMDLISAICHQHISEVDNSDFDIKILPKSGKSSKKVAQALDGIIRHIELSSGAQYTYSYATRDIVKGGMGAWRINLRYTNDYDFTKDLFIDYIPNAKDRVWFDVNDLTQDKSKSRHAWCLTPMAMDLYKEKYPEGSGISVGQNRYSDLFIYKPETVIIGEYFYKKKKKKKLVKMSNGWVLEKNDLFKSVVDDLAIYGVTVAAERTAECDVVYRMMFDGTDWLDDDTETVFNDIPLIPVYGNYSVIEDKSSYYGEPEKLADVQRVINFTYSRLVEDTSLRPKTKLAITTEQEKGFEVEHSTMNVDNNPKVRYNHADNQNPPYYLQAPAPDPALVTILQASTDYVNKISGMFAANMGDNPGIQSGVAIGAQIERGNNSTNRYMQAKEIAMVRTAKILIGAIPNVEAYQGEDLVRIVGKDGGEDYIDIRETVVDQQTGQQVKLYDFSKGEYDVVCTVGSSFKSQQAETVDMIVKLAQIMPELPQLSADVIMQNISAPGMNDIAQRIREQMVKAGLIPMDQLNDDEKQVMAQIQQQGQQISPEQQAQLGIAQAEMKRVEAETADIISKAQERSAKAQLEANKQRFDQMLKTIAVKMDKVKLDSEIDKNDAQTMSMIKDATGAYAIMSENAVKAYEQKARDLITGNSLNAGANNMGTAPVLMPERTSEDGTR